MFKTFKFIGKEYEIVDDPNCNCLNNTCPFIDRDCENLQEYGEIPLCSSWERFDRKNVAFILKEDKCQKNM